MNSFGAGEQIDPFRPPPLSKRTPGDWKYRTPAQQAEIKIKRLEMRAAMDSNAARAWADLIEAELGPEPPMDQPEAWWQYGLSVRRLAATHTWGPSASAVSRAADAYAEQCCKTAAVINPARFGPKAQIDTSVRVRHTVDSNALTSEQREELRRMLHTAIEQAEAIEHDSGEANDG